MVKFRGGKCVKWVWYGILINFFYKYIYYIYFIYVWFEIYFLVNVFNLCMLLFDGNFFIVKMFIFWFVYLNCFRFVEYLFC